MRRPEAVTTQQALLVVQQPRRGGKPITDVVHDVRSMVLQRPGVICVEPYELKTDGTAALLAVTVARPRVLKGIVGNGITACYRDVDARTATAIARQYDDALAAAALRWSSGRATMTAHA